jgi:hypothetical protein
MSVSQEPHDPTTRHLGINDEQARILNAALDGRLVANKYNRWVIDGEPRPVHRERTKLQKRGMLDYPKEGGYATSWSILVPTLRGVAALAAREVRHVA